VSFTTWRHDDTVVVGIEGQLVVRNRQEFKQRVLDELERGERKFRFDFSQTGYIDSSGLGVLVSLNKKIREQRGDLQLANLNEDLEMLFALTKLDTLFHLGDGDDGVGGAGVTAPVPRPPRATGGEQSMPPHSS
jgi:anti-sigma B factor antagonist